MKKLVLIIAAISACFAVSCKKENLKENTNSPVAKGMQEMVLTASINDVVVTKESYTGGTTFTWNAGDQISVLCSDGNFYTFSATSTAASTTFTGSIPEGESLGAYAFFPADAAHAYSGLKFSIPEEKDLTGHASADLPMVGDKGEGNTYSFGHCSGAVLLTIDNIPDQFVTMKITVTHPSLKLSGLFGVFTSEGHWRYNPAGGSTDSEKTFIRKVNVVNHAASIYIPYAYGADWWGKNTINVIGYDSSDNPTTLIASKTMSSSLGTIERAHVKPLKPLPLNRLAYIDWTDTGIASSEVNPSDSRKCLTELKATADDYYMYARVKGPLSLFSGDYLDVYLSDGSGDHYALADDNKYWTTGGETVYREEHKGPVTSSSLTMTFNSKSVDTITENVGDDIFWYIAFPRSAHSLLSSSGTVYVGFVLWNGWSVTGVIPTKYSAMLEVALP